MWVFSTSGLFLVYVKIQLKTIQWKYNTLPFLTAVQWWCFHHHQHSWIQSSQAGFLTDWFHFQTQRFSLLMTGYRAAAPPRHSLAFVRKDSLWLPGSNWTLSSVLTNTAGWSMLTDSACHTHSSLQDRLTIGKNESSVGQGRQQVLLLEKKRTMEIGTENNKCPLKRWGHFQLKMGQQDRAWGGKLTMSWEVQGPFWGYLLHGCPLRIFPFASWFEPDSSICPSRATLPLQALLSLGRSLNWKDDRKSFWPLSDFWLGLVSGEHPQKIWRGPSVLF